MAAGCGRCGPTTPHNVIARCACGRVASGRTDHIWTIVADVLSLEVQHLVALSPSFDWLNDPSDPAKGSHLHEYVQGVPLLKLGELATADAGPMLAPARATSTIARSPQEVPQMSWSMHIDDTPRERMSEAIARANPSPDERASNRVQAGQVDAAKAAAQALLGNIAGVIEGRPTNDILRASISGHASSGQDSPDSISITISAVRSEKPRSTARREAEQKGETVPTFPPPAERELTIETPPTTGTGAEATPETPKEPKPSA
jgi:hypothetical protein